MPAPVGIVASQRSVTAWTPASLTGLQLWLDANDATTFTYSSGTVVSQWRDKSGGSHHANTLVGSPNRDTTVNGHLTIRFPAQNTWFRFTGYRGVVHRR